MKENDSVPLLVEVPRTLRIRVRVAAAGNELTIGKFVVAALEAAVQLAEEVPHDAE